MQSMATGTPVIISKTIGFWDYDNFIDNKNIFLLEDGSIDLGLIKLMRFIMTLTY